jgi:hypothetical protein
VGEYATTVDLVVLPIQGYDAILGMPWLKQENPTIDWSAGLVKIKDLEIHATHKKQNNRKNKKKKQTSEMNQARLSPEPEPEQKESVCLPSERTRLSAILLSRMQFAKEARHRPTYLCFVR